MRSAKAALFVVMLATLFQSMATASPVTLLFDGRVTHVGDPFNLVGSAIAPGDAVAIALNYDTSTTDFYPDPFEGRYITPGYLRVSINGLTFEQRYDIQVNALEEGFDSGAATELMVFSAGAFPGPAEVWPATLPEFDVTNISISFIDPESPFALFPHSRLPTAAEFSSLAGQLMGKGELLSGTWDESKYSVQFDFDAPEPSTLTLMGVGLGLILWRQLSGTKSRRAPRD